MGKNQMKEILPDPTSVFPCVQNDIQHSCPIRPTIDSPLPSSNSLSLGDAQPEDRGVDDGAFFKAARRTAIETGLFSGRRLWRSPTIIEMSSSFEVLPRLIKIAKKESFM